MQRVVDQPDLGPALAESIATLQGCYEDKMGEFGGRREVISAC